MILNILHSKNNNIILNTLHDNKRKKERKETHNNYSKAGVHTHIINTYTIMIRHYVQYTLGTNSDQALYTIDTRHHLSSTRPPS